MAMAQRTASAVEENAASTPSPSHSNSSPPAEAIASDKHFVMSLEEIGTGLVAGLLQKHSRVHEVGEHQRDGA